MPKEMFERNKPHVNVGNHRSHRPRQVHVDRCPQRARPQVPGHRQGAAVRRGDHRRHPARRHQDGNDHRVARGIRIGHAALRARGLPGPRRLHQEHDRRGGRHTPFFTGHRPQFYFRTTDVTGTRASAGRRGHGPSGRHRGAARRADRPPSRWRKKLRFAVREGGKTSAPAS